MDDDDADVEQWDDDLFLCCRFDNFRKFFCVFLLLLRFLLLLFHLAADMIMMLSVSQFDAVDVQVEEG